MTPDNRSEKRQFSLKLYLFIVFAISWPFQLFIFFFPDLEWAPKMFLVSMIMVSAGTLLAGRFVFRDTFRDAGWNWGKPLHYVMAFILPLFIWVVPVLLQIGFNLQTIPQDFNFTDLLIMFILSFLVTLIPAFGEEFGWRGYLLPRLVKKYSVKKALLLQAFIWWFWHVPVLVYSALNNPVAGTGPVLAIAGVLIISIIPAMMHAVIFSYFWTKTSSLAVTTVYHAAFDEVRDATQNTLGFGPFTQLWQMLVITAIGAYLYFNGDWKRLKRIKETEFR